MRLPLVIGSKRCEGQLRIVVDGHLGKLGARNVASADQFEIIPGDVIIRALILIPMRSPVSAGCRTGWISILNR